MESYPKKMESGGACEEFGPLLVLYAAGELEENERGRVREHLAKCAECAAEWAEQNQMLAAFAERRQEPDSVLLASCRNGLVDALDREEERGWLGRALGRILPENWLNPQPAWSAALLLMLGFGVGMVGPRIAALRHGTNNGDAGSVASGGFTQPVISGATNAGLTSTTDSPARDLDLHTADVAGIRVIPSDGDEPPQVELQLKSQEPLQGTVDNDNIKRVLLHILANGQSSDPDARLDAVDLLRVRNNDPDVRSGLCHAVHSDPNAAVRLKALEALNGAEPQDLVRQTLLDALVDDQNPGVRVEAINALREMAAKGQVSSDDHMLAVLRDRMQKDPNTYIRLQSAAAIRDLGPREKF
ncbi:MAG TPA: HEAT repeat domain-containing protein [Candidatus Acidoferrum sp.]|nr:HEAT repeat domain-containing protein [Candidatus Acidoferrum sp.]